MAGLVPAIHVFDVLRPVIRHPEVAASAAFEG